MLYVRSFLFSLGMIINTVCYALAALVVIPFPFRTRYNFVVHWADVNLWLLRVFCGIHYQMEGAEHIPSQPCIVLAKHQSTWETMMLARIFSPQAWVLKRELLWVPFFGWGLALVEPIAIDRKSGRRAVQQIIEEGGKRLRDRRWVVIFPEGTRIPPGKKGRYGIGGAVLAEKTGYPVLPVAHNAGEFWGRRSFLKQPGVIKLVIGEPIASEGRSADEIRTLTEQWIETTMARISNVPYPRWQPQQAAKTAKTQDRGG